MTKIQNDTGTWLDIVEYAKTYEVSVSTLRRRIRSGSIQFKLAKGKYWLEDSRSVMGKAPLFSRDFPRKNLCAKCGERL